MTNDSFFFIFFSMAYNQRLADRIREQLQDVENIEEKEMMGGLSFLLNGKMCVGIIKDEMMCRIDPARYEESLEKNGCHEMVFTGKHMKGWVMIEEEGMKNIQDFRYWIDLALAYNQHAKPSKKKK